ncbi:cyclohydrolase [Auricularia subglabra TFB-10046 SS5]|nr:cyclohydrolase [Auricularia subglabra TFB-10046 SS5]
MAVIADEVLAQILSKLESLTASQEALQSKLDALSGQGQSASAPSRGIPVPGSPSVPAQSLFSSGSPPVTGTSPLSVGASAFGLGAGAPKHDAALAQVLGEDDSRKERERKLYPSRVILTTYPGQTGIHPLPLNWTGPTAAERGPVVCSRQASSIKLRNAIGAHSGSYSIYRALAVAMGTLDPTHRPSFKDTEPPASIQIKPNPAWSKVVSFDPWGHLVPQVFAKELEAGVDVRPSIAVTKAHIKLSELDDSARRGQLKIDGKVVLESRQIMNPDGTPSDIYPGVELATSKAAVEPVWYLPGVAERFGISESLLRRALFEDTGGMYPELITRPDIKVFLPPIGNLTVYIFGNPAFVSDESKELTLRVHDECNGSDVFGSDICTCKPYLVFAIEECVRCAQRGGVGVVVYFRKEGRALGEVTKYLVYNLRKRGGDSADKYFRSTEVIAGVKDMRFQALMPDVLHWLGIRKIDNMVSMSDMKYDAIVQSGIPIHKRYDLPEHLIPPDSRVEIDAKIAAGYFTSGKKITTEDLVKTVGRTWEEVDH